MNDIHNFHRAFAEHFCIWRRRHSFASVFSIFKRKLEIRSNAAVSWFSKAIGRKTRPLHHCRFCETRWFLQFSTWGKEPQTPYFSEMFSCLVLHIDEICNGLCEFKRESWHMARIDERHILWNLSAAAHSAPPNHCDKRLDIVGMKRLLHLINWINEPYIRSTHLHITKARIINLINTAKLW